MAETQSREPFVKLPEHPFIICMRCQQGLISSEITNHMKKHRREYTLDEQQRIVDQVTAWPDVIPTQEALRLWTPPPPDTWPIPFIKPVSHRGIGCNACQYVVHDMRTMQKHCQQKHGWVNNWHAMQGNGQQRARQPRNVMWRTGVACQQWMNQGVRKAWFEVGGGRTAQDEAAAAAAAGGSITSMLQAVDMAMRAAPTTVDTMGDASLDANKWLRFVGWADHLQGLSEDTLYAMGQLPNEADGRLEDDEARLDRMLASVDRVTSRAQWSCQPSIVGDAALYEIERDKTGKGTKPKLPLHADVRDATWQRYTTVWKRIICVIDRAERAPGAASREANGDKQRRREPSTSSSTEDDSSESELEDALDEDVDRPEPWVRPPYRMTARQTRALEAWWQAAASGRAGEDESRREDDMDEACLVAAIALLDHNIGDDKYRSPLISALAVIAMRRDHSWVPVADYTVVYSAVVKIARMMVVYDARRQREEALHRAMQDDGLTEEEARDQVGDVVQLVQQRVRRYMVRADISGPSIHSPMDRIYEFRSYGLKVRYTTSSENTVAWHGSTVTFRTTSLCYLSMREGIHRVVFEAQALLGELAMVWDRAAAAAIPWQQAARSMGDDGPRGLPAILWDRVVDDRGETAMGYSFLTEPKNEAWVAKGKDWVPRQVEASAVRRAQWQFRRDDDGRVTFRTERARHYGQVAEEFRARMWVLMHATSMPSRTPEINGIRFENTANEGVRNVFVDQRLVCFITWYHKGFNHSSNVKIVQRYLPRKVGALLVYYLWLVLPFWQRILYLTRVGKHGRAARPEAFLWARVVLREDEDDDMAEGEGEDEQGAGWGGRSRADDYWRSRVVSETGAPQSTPSRATPSGPSRTPPGNTSRLSQSERRNSATGGGENRRRGGLWNNERVRRILQKTTARTMGVGINIAQWRHLVIAVARRFIGVNASEIIEQASAEDDDVAEGEGEGGAVTATNAVEMQTGHSGAMGAMVYARAMGQGSFEREDRRALFRDVSERWHRFLGFHPSQVGIKRGFQAMSATGRTPGEARERRLRALQNAPGDAVLSRLTGRPGARLRPQQRALFQLVAKGYDRVLCVAPTGSGKSLAFMLPAYMTPEGVSVVVTPLVALEEDMQRRCEERGLRSHVWSAGAPTPGDVSILFVTPESVDTSLFQEYVGRLQRLDRLDRVVIDECHTVLDAHDRFRPRLKQMGDVVNSWGVQVVYLTATLPPRDEGMFFRGVGVVNPASVEVIRVSTTRVNIRYEVTSVAGRRQSTQSRAGAARGQGEARGLAVDDGVAEIIDEWVAKGGSGRAIVYGSSIDQVVRLAERLDVPRYHSRLASQARKRAVFERWARADSRRAAVMVATNALGLGIDVPDVRLVVHAGMPRQMRDFAQESGRGGRDGQASRSVVVVEEGWGRQEHTKRTWEPESVLFVEGARCRRETIDEAMDGAARVGREGACQGEEIRCDVCAEREAACYRALRQELEAMQAADHDAAEALYKWEMSQTVTQEVDGVEVERRPLAEHRQLMKSELTQREGRRQRELASAAEFEPWAAEVPRVCPICEEMAGHQWTDCDEAEEEELREVARYEREIQDRLFRARRLGRFVCWECGFPQAVCESWIPAYGDEGQFRKATALGLVCRRVGVLGRIWAVWMAEDWDGLLQEVRASMRQDGITIGDARTGAARVEDMVWDWLGKVERKGGIRVINLCWFLFQRWRRLVG